ncbi:hypothetical protein [Pyrobaculum arsenaticum]|nr:hypothetical protein [Pyrobaculum arsenaticum]
MERKVVFGLALAALAVLIMSATYPHSEVQTPFRRCSVRGEVGAV